MRDKSKDHRRMLGLLKTRTTNIFGTPKCMHAFRFECEASHY